MRCRTLHPRLGKLTDGNRAELVHIQKENLFCSDRLQHYWACIEAAVTTYLVKQMRSCLGCVERSSVLDNNSTTKLLLVLILFSVGHQAAHSSLSYAAPKPLVSWCSRPFPVCCGASRGCGGSVEPLALRTLISQLLPIGITYSHERRPHETLRIFQ